MTKKTEEEDLFEVINLTAKKGAFMVEVEITETRERRRFGYPINSGWETEIKGESKFMIDIERKLRDEFVSETSFDIDTIKNKVKGKKVKK
jgi:hypothetical protein